MSIARTPRPGRRPLGRMVLISLATLACATLSGCAASGAASAVAFPSANEPQAFNLNASPSSAATVAAAATISVKVNDANPVVGIRPKGWSTFTVVVTNSSGTDVQNVLPLVVFGPCTCDPASGVPPHYQLQILDALSGKWTPASAVSTDAHGAYAFERQTDPVTLGAGQSLTYQYRVILSGKKTGLRDGTGDVDVYLVQQPGHTRLTGATGPDASFVLNYQPK